MRPAADSPPFASRQACLPDPRHSLNCASPTDGGDSAGSSSGDVDFIPGLDKCGTPEFDAAASKADLQAYFQSNGEAAAAACASAALDDFASICDCYVVLDNWMELSCPPCVKTEIERMVRHTCVCTAVQCGWWVGLQERGCAAQRRGFVQRSFVQRAWVSEVTAMAQRCLLAELRCCRRCAAAANAANAAAAVVNAAASAALT